MDYSTFLIRTVICFSLSLIVGLERQWRRRAIGLRTNVLVSLGSFLFVSFSIQTGSLDISRIASQVVSGIGFLGAGVILKDGTNIKGLNTAATLWCNAAIGVLCAGGLLVEAGIGTAMILIANIILRAVTHKLKIIETSKPKYENYQLKITCEEEKEIIVRTFISQSVHEEDMILEHLESKSFEVGKTKIYAEFKVSKHQTSQIETLMNRVTMEPGIISTGWKKIEKVEEEIDDD